ncbi:GtrA family protein [Alicyclobacillus dauci]|uniref:GtrA family protein n=1 Tax=Alicyclobacillus dauci TaxID=1475485 RepID=A0ABY6Z4L5_9BACL|nr:GtrA family protein [Alicyclobacillus dauci]WAH37801.1 GtrA family protein [Alicyclobacillus dauci]
MKPIKRATFQLYTKQAALFCIVGFTNFIVDIAVFFSAYHWLHLNDLAAQAVSYPCGAVNSFFLNRRLTFKKRGPLQRIEMVRFAMLNVLSIVGSLLALYCSDHLLTLGVSNGKLVANGCALCMNFCGSKWWVFRRKPASVIVVAPDDIQQPLVFDPTHKDS